MASDSTSSAHPETVKSYVSPQTLQDLDREDELAAESEAARHLADVLDDGLEESCLDRQAGDVLAEVDVAITIDEAH